MPLGGTIIEIGIALGACLACPYFSNVFTLMLCPTLLPYLKEY
jgi:hypothetical protein